MAEEIKSIKTLDEHYKNNLSALQDLRDVLLGNRVEITFYPNGGSAVRNTVVYMKQSFGELPKPYKPGYDFAGWYRNYDNVSVPGEEFFADPIHDYDPVSVSVHSLKLFAKWDPAWIPIHLNANGGVVNPEVISVKYLSRFAEAYQGPGMPSGLPYPTNASNRFIGWTSEMSTDGIPTGNPYTNDTMMTLTEGFYLYANWSQMIFYLSYDMNGGKGTLDRTSAVVGLVENNKFGLSSVQQAISAGAYKEGYDLAGFSLMRNSNAILTGNYVECSGKDVTVYAVWRRHSYQIDYRKDNATSLTTKNRDPNSTPWNPQRVLVDWIDYLNFLDEFKEKVRNFRRWTSVTGPNGQPVNKFVARLMPYDGDMVYNYATGQNQIVAIRPATQKEVEAVEKWTLVPNSVSVTSNPLSGLELNHGDTLSSIYEDADHNKHYFKLSAQLSCKNGNRTEISNLRNLLADEIRVYPSMAQYISPTNPAISTGNSFAVVSFAWDDITYGQKIPLTVKKTLSYIEIYSRPNKTSYKNGATLDPTGLALSVVYADGAESEIVKWDSSDDCPIFCTMDEDRQETANKTVTLLNKTMYVYFEYGGKTVKTSIPLQVTYSTVPSILIETTSDARRKSFEPDDDTIIDPSDNGIGLGVYKTYSSEPYISGHPELQKTAVHDYVFYPKTVSENEITNRTDSDPNYLGTVAISVYYADTDFEVTLSGTTPVSIYKPFGISSLRLDTGSITSKTLTVPYQDRYLVLRQSQHLSDIKLFGNFNRIGQGGTSVNIGECKVEPSLLDPLCSKLSIYYGDSIPLEFPVTVNLDSRCYCGIIALFEGSASEIGVKGSKRINACKEKKIDPVPYLYPQSFGGDFSYYYSGDKYVAYQISDGGTTKTVVRKSENDAEHIRLGDYTSMVANGDHYVCLSIFYTDPTKVRELNNHLFKRDSCADSNSIVRSVNFGVRVNGNAPGLNSVSAVRNFGAYQERMEYCFIGDDRSKLTEVGHNAFTNCKGLRRGIILPEAYNGNHSVGAYSRKTLILPTWTSTIRENAFYHCESFTNMVPWGVPEAGGISARVISAGAIWFHLSSIGERAFEGMTSLSDVNSRIFGRHNSDKNDFRPWGNPDVVGIPARCFYGCSSLTNIGLGEVKLIASSAFYGCSKLAGAHPAAFTCNYTYGGKSYDLTVKYRLSAVGAHAFKGTKITKQNCGFLSSVQINKYAFS